ncbi:MAG: GGDEF domain-containing protein [Rhodospirillaceae bacterium]|nr:GGDEF domain-containing protein [Rhodospirillaceae bacterium]MBT6291993.1 GGDEF domain-containing protein [Rhodospirillaceae bacterium]
MAEIREVQAYGRAAGYTSPGDPRSGGGDGAQPKPKSRESRQIRDTARVLGIPAAEFTPRVQDAVALILNEMDLVRFELEVCHNHEKHILDLADRHAYLPTLNRRAFERELSRATVQVERSGEAGWLITVVAAGMELVRRASGLKAVEFIEAKLAELAIAAIPATTPIGAIGIAEFGVLLVEADRALAEETAARIAARFEAVAIEFEGQPFTIIAHWGVAEIGPAALPDAVRHAADADQRARAGDPNAGSPAPAAGEAAKSA